MPRPPTCYHNILDHSRIRMHVFTHVFTQTCQGAVSALAYGNSARERRQNLCRTATSLSVTLS